MKGVVASVMHTGTWFTLDLVQGLTGETALPWGLSFQDEGQDFDWVHVHVDPSPQKHPWDRHRFFRHRLVRALVPHHRTVVPVRDPVLALISKENRRNRLIGLPDVGAWEWIVDAFGEVAGWYHRPPGPMFFLPVDLPRTPAERHRLLAELSEFLGASPDRGRIERLARAWRPRNTTDDRSGLRSAYGAGDLEAVRRVLPREMERLRALPEIAAMYRDLGYELPWLPSPARERVG